MHSRPPDWSLDRADLENLQFYSAFPFFVLADWKIFWCSGWLGDDPAAKHGHVQEVSGGSPHCSSLLCGSEHVGPSEKHLSKENAHADGACESLFQTQELLQLPAPSADWLSHHQHTHTDCFSSALALPPAAKHRERQKFPISV